MLVEREFHLFFNFLGWSHLSCGLHVGLDGPHIELHLPFGFVRLGWMRLGIPSPRCFGWYGSAE